MYLYTYVCIYTHHIRTHAFLTWSYLRRNNTIDSLQVLFFIVTLHSCTTQPSALFRSFSLLCCYIKKELKRTSYSKNNKNDKIHYSLSFLVLYYIKKPKRRGFLYAFKKYNNSHVCMLCILNFIVIVWS